MADIVSNKTAENAISAKRNTIIAIGGAKGGIGKSVFCANLGVYLSSKKFKTILVDLDLGAANLHLFLGLWSLERKLQDYLVKNCKSIEDTLISTPYGPLLSGGGGANLGAAHISFAQKLKLIRALKSINADFTLIDLGGDTTFNSLDYFLAADIQIILTSCDPASYLDAYNFLKLALYRKLTRIFGPESNRAHKRDPALVAHLEGFINTGVSGTGKRIETLLDEIRQRHPKHLKMVTALLGEFKPNLVINMVNKPLEARLLAERLQKVSKRMLCVELNHLGTIAYDEDVKQCTLDLIPYVVRHPRGILSGFFDKSIPVITG